jgi:tRNA-2-methylthio-N6-dimethylallyladenosine synthase
MARLVEVVQRTARERAGRFVGSVREVLVEGPSRTDPSRLRGRLSQNITVNFTGSAAPGTLAPVLVEGATSTTLSGREVEVAVPA